MKQTPINYSLKHPKANQTIRQSLNNFEQMQPNASIIPVQNQIGKQHSRFKDMSLIMEESEMSMTNQARIQNLNESLMNQQKNSAQ